MKFLKNVNKPWNPTAPAAHLAYFIAVTGIYNSLSVDGGLDPFEELFTKIRIFWENNNNYII